MDNYATHKTPKVKAWLARRPRWHAHFTPTSASWLNQIEHWFAELTRKKIQRGVHRSVAELEADIMAFIDRTQRRSKAIQMAQISRPNPRLRQAILPQDSEPNFDPK